MVTVRRITTDDPLYPQECDLRERVLLGPIGLDIAKFRAMFPGVEEKFEHFVAVLEHPTGPRVVGCATLLPNLESQGSYGGPGVALEPGARWGKLMQMAVDPQRQGEGIGTRLVVAVERRAFGELGHAALYCHARDTAYGFYDSLGWDFDSEVFDEAGVPHRRMVFRGVQDED